jgi:hypothetical protein
MAGMDRVSIMHPKHSNKKKINQKSSPSLVFVQIRSSPTFGSFPSISFQSLSMMHHWVNLMVFSVMLVKLMGFFVQPRGIPVVMAFVTFCNAETSGAS